MSLFAALAFDTCLRKTTSSEQSLLVKSFNNLVNLRKLIKIYDKNMSPTRSAKGIFATKAILHYPHMIAIEEGRLTDDEQRTRFLIELFALSEFNHLKKTTKSPHRNSILVRLSN